MKKICVFCGSSSGNREEYSSAASELGRELAKRNIGLVYGGASVGIMGALADSVLENGGEVTGVIPESLVESVGHEKLTELHVVDTMHARKALMFELSCAFIALPGGLGTLEEIFEVLTWGQLGFHKKPCGILNISGYFDHLLRFLEHSVSEKFVKEAHFDMLQNSETVGGLLDKLQHNRMPDIKKWID
jgi:hypothetical protein